MFTMPTRGIHFSNFDQRPKILPYGQTSKNRFSLCILTLICLGSKEELAQNSSRKPSGFYVGDDEGSMEEISKDRDE